MPKTPFIVIEALDAGGSQTQTGLLADKLTSVNYTVTKLHFPQEDRATGRLIYEKFLLYKNKYPFSRREQALLYIQDFFSRADDIAGVLRVGRKNIVLSDRFCTSTMAYQTVGLTGRARTAMLKWISWLCYEGTPALPKPDLVLFIDTPVEVSLKRLKDKKKDYFETKEKLTAIRNSYLRLAKQHKWHSVPSITPAGHERTREEIHEDIWKGLQGIISPPAGGGVRGGGS